MKTHHESSLTLQEYEPRRFNKTLTKTFSLWLMPIAVGILVLAIVLGVILLLLNPIFSNPMNG